jgi:GxxExxY protein
MQTKSTLDELNIISKSIISSAIEVHKKLGPGLLESIYHECLIKELQARNIHFCTQVEMPIVYKDFKVEKKYVIDLLVEDEVVVELKAVDGILPVHEAQLLTYLKITGKRLGLLINFNVPVLVKGVTRMLNGY